MVFRSNKYRTKLREYNSCALQYLLCLFIVISPPQTKYTLSYHGWVDTIQIHAKIKNATKALNNILHFNPFPLPQYFLISHFGKYKEKRVNRNKARPYSYDNGYRCLFQHLKFQNRTSKFSSYELNSYATFNTFIIQFDELNVFNAALFII